MKSLFLSFALFLVFNSNLFSQKVYRWYQDGKVVFQLSNQAKKYKCVNGIVDNKNMPFTNDAIYRYQITGVKALHPNIKDFRWFS